LQAENLHYNSDQHENENGHPKVAEAGESNLIADQQTGAHRGRVMNMGRMAFITRLLSVKRRENIRGRFEIANLRLEIAKRTRASSPEDEARVTLQSGAYLFIP